MSRALKCFKCMVELENVYTPGNQPNNGLEFHSYGHYGSTAFDPMDGTFLVINICDGCLKRHSKVVLLAIPEQRGPRNVKYKQWAPHD